MPRKTGARSEERGMKPPASMRPRPDAAENPGDVVRLRVSVASLQ